MVFRTRILQDVAEYAIRTADREPVVGGFSKESSSAEPPAEISRGDRTSAHLTSASAIALGPWAVFALSFLILAAYRDEIESILDPSLSAAIDLDGLDDLSKALAGEPGPIRMFGQSVQATNQIGSVSGDDVFDAPSFGAGPVLSGPTAGPYSVAMLPDEIFNFNLTDTKDTLNPLGGDDRHRDFAMGGGGNTISEQAIPVRFDGDPTDGGDEGGGENGDGGGNGDGGEEGGGGNGDGGGDGGRGEGLVVGGSSDDDNLVGSAANDLIFGYEGNDQISALGGDDILVSGDGNDQLDGGAGFDIAAFLAPSTEFVIYRNADGSLTVENHKTGDETQLVNVESLYFMDGNYDVAEFPDQIGRIDTTGLLDDQETTQDLIDANGGSGDGAIIKGDSGDNDLVGTDGDDVIFGGDGNDRLAGLGGDDILVGGNGGGVISGGDGNDVAAFLAPSTVMSLYLNKDGSYLLEDTRNGEQTIITDVERLLFQDGFVDLAGTGTKPGQIVLSDWLDTSETYKDVIGQIGGGADDPVIIIDEKPSGSGDVIYGDSGDNDLFGTDRDDALFGGPGNDRLAGLGGDDLLVAEPGEDLVDGGDGHDIAAFQGKSTDYALYLMSDGSFSLVNNLTEAETILFNVEDIYFSDGFIAVSAVERGGLVDIAALLDSSATSEDLLATYGGDDKGGEGEGEGKPVLVPSDAGQTVIGDDGDNDLVGTNYDDTIVGGAGDDRLSGLDGSDIFYDGPGNDLVDGGAGIDLAAFRGASTDYALYAMSDGSFSLVNDRTEEETVLRNVEQLYFSDGVVDLSGLDRLDGRIDMAFLLDTSTTSADLPSPSEDIGATSNLGLLLMGDAGDNDLVGTERDDLLFGGPGSDRISGLGGEDVIIADPGSDLIDGGDGMDIAGFQGGSEGYSLYNHGDGSFTVQNSKSGETTQIVNVESVYFNDGNIDLTALPGKEGAVFLGDLLDTDATIDNLFGLADSYGTETGDDDTPDRILVLAPPPPVFSAPLELMPHPETGESV